MFDEKSFKDGIELGERLGKGRVLFEVWLYDLPDLKKELIDVIFSLKDEELNRTDITEAVLEAVSRLSDKVNKKHNELSVGENNEQV